MIMRKKSLLVWSSLIFTLPLALAAYFRIWLTAAALIAVIITSLLYHRSQGKKFQRLDALFARLLIVSNLWICYLGHFVFPYFAIVLALILADSYFYFREERMNYPLGHSLWHLFSALITVFSILTFIKGSGLL